METSALADGEPSSQECSPNAVQDSVTVAAQGLAGSPSISTYVVGVGLSLTALNQIAAAGGTQAAFLVDAGPNVTVDFIAALNEIREVALGCEYQIPEPGAGQLDFDRVNVQYTPPSGAAVVVHQVPNAAACDPVKGGWYYDDPQAPTRIVVCGTSCDGFNVVQGGQVDILLGCETITNPPR
jgi:hypothetical protein